MKYVFLGLFAVTWYMVGLIWMVQIVHYPLFARVDGSRFVEYMHEHQRLISMIVIGPMVAELVLTIWWAWNHPSVVPDWLPYTGLVFVVVVWFSTFLLQVPRHQQLTLGYNGGTINLLVQTNWIRTVAWTAHGFLLLFTMSKLMK